MMRSNMRFETYKRDKLHMKLKATPKTFCLICVFGNVGRRLVAITTVSPSINVYGSFSQWECISPFITVSNM